MNKTLEERGYIELEPGSYFHYIEKTWFERFQPHLTLRNGAWIPNMEHITALNELLKEYTEWSRIKAYAQIKRQEELRGKTN